MPTLEKEQTINQVREKVLKAKALFFTDYRGLKVNELQALRTKIEEKGAEYQVIKNTLLNLACKNADRSIPNTQVYFGPTAVLFCYQDEVAPLKDLVNFAKDNNQLPRVKGGFLGEHVFGEEEIKRLLTLPTKTVLYTQLLATLSSPLRRFLTVGKTHSINLINVLNEIKSLKEKNN